MTATKSMLEKICGDECDGRYCILKEIVLATNSDRVLMQIKEIEIFKFLQSKKDVTEYNWEQSTKMWVDNRYAEFFAVHYNPDLSPIELYKKIEQSVENVCKK